MNREKPLDIYMASAGSGKTYTLTLNYLKILLSDDDGGMLPSELHKGYRRILAVTFTNKATEEMKRRVVETLFSLYSEQKPASVADSLIEAGCAADKGALSQKAGETLFNLLHDYSNFNISTIDAFFQRTMRAFARDIGLQGGYNVEINAKGVTDEAIERMYSSLDTDDSRELTRWLLKYNEEAIEEGKKWNAPENSISSLSQQLFNEGYKEWRNAADEDELPDKTGIESYNSFLKRIIRTFESEVRKLHAEGAAILKGVENTELYKRSASPLNFFLKPLTKVTLPNKTFLSLPDIPDKWAQKDASQHTVDAVERLKAAKTVEQIAELFEKEYKPYVTAKKTCQELYSFGILSDIDKHIREIERERNIMLLSDTTELLNKIIDGNDTPFVYEKTGVFIRHFMIDEFQDTSRMQWKNFFPLIAESIASGGKNLIVGDIKQSIYRWRNSDWRLLRSLASDDSPVRREDTGVYGLDTNWRSDGNIVGFNNRFFPIAVKLLQDSIEKPEMRNVIGEAYGDVCQKLPEGKARDEGFVSINIIPAERSAVSNDFNLAAAEKLYDDICRLTERGISPSGMAILVRQKKETAFIAEYILKRLSEEKTARKFRVISDEALLLGNSTGVRLIISILRFIAAPENRNNRFLARYETSLLRGKDCEEAVRYALQTEDADENMTAWIDKISNMPLFDMCEEIISYLGIGNDERQVPYIQAFQDCVLEYSERHGSNLSAFLEWWGGESEKISLSSPPGNDAVRIMTIHKSKGLEFDTVFIPFCKWKMGVDDRNIVWCNAKTPEAPAWKVPVKAQKDMGESEYADIYETEQMLTYTDNLNIAYVAFTRARHNMIIYAPELTGANKNPAGDMYKVLQGALSIMADEFPDEIRTESENGRVVRYVAGHEPECAGEEVAVKAETLRYKSVRAGERLRMKLRGATYFDAASARNYGSLMHEVLSGIVSAEDMDKRIGQFVSDGEISAEEGRKLASLINAHLSDERVKGWFDGKATVLRETSILQPGSQVMRPDRIVIGNGKVSVIDYKFGAERGEHRKQMQNYLSLVRRMGYFDVKGYLWYLSVGRIVEIE